MQKKEINLIAKNNCPDEINWPNHLRVIKVIKFTKAKSQSNSETGFKLNKKHYKAKQNVEYKNSTLSKL